MSDVKWIKITADIFDDEKILMIESLPSADSIIVIWFKLLTFTGKQNNNGVLVMSNMVAYTDEMLASIFRRDIAIVRAALSTFKQFGMIEIIEGIITIPNWNKHQNLDSYEKKKIRDREYQAERRKQQRTLIEKSLKNRLTDNDCHTMESSYVAVSEREEEKERDKDIIVSKDTICPELEKSTPGSSEILLPLLDGTFYEVPEDKLNKWGEAFPAVDIVQELRKMYLWLESNPKKRKTRRGVERFIYGWLERAQNKGGNIKANSNTNTFVDDMRGWIGNE